MTKQRPLAEAARPAAAWWGDQVRGVRPETDGLHTALSAREAQVATARIALRGQELDTAPVTDAVIAQFVDELARAVAAQTRDHLLLRVDYAACRELGEAADRAGVPDVRFPHKTWMRVRPDYVLVRAGYGAPTTVVWSAAGWQHPPCGAQQWPPDAPEPNGPPCTQPRWHRGPCDWQ